MLFYATPTDRAVAGRFKFTLIHLSMAAFAAGILLSLGCGGNGTEEPAPREPTVLRLGQPDKPEREQPEPNGAAVTAPGDIDPEAIEVVPRPEDDPRLRRAVDPALHLDRDELPDERNAWPLWAEAIDRFDAEVYSERYREMISTVLEDGVRALTDSHRRELARYVADQQPVMDLIAAGIERGASRPPLPDNGAFTQMPHLAHLRGIAFVLLADAHLAAGDGRFEHAVDRLTQALGMGGLMVEGAHSMIEGLVGYSILAATVEWSPEVALKADMPQAARRRLLQALVNETDDAAAVAGMWRGEFWMNAWELRRLEEGERKGALSEAVVILGEVLWMEHAEDLRRLISMAGALREATNGEDVSLVDAGASIGNISELWLVQLRAFDEPWKPDRGDELQDRLEQMMARTARRGPAIEQLHRQLERRRTLSGQQQREAREALMNLVGDTFAQSMFTAVGMVERTARQTTASRRAAAVALACVIFEDEHGRMPDTLAELAEQRLLPAVPTDPFAAEAEQPLYYDAERRMVWTVGADQDRADRPDPDRGPREGRPTAWRIARPQ